MEPRAVRVAWLALISAALIPSVRAEADSGDPSRAVIRGTGKDVAIVYRSGASARPPRAEAVRARENVLAEAVRMTEGGAEDASVVAYLRNHQADLPPIVRVDEVRSLRRAGAGDPVISFLSRLAALDIGETAEGSAPPPAAYAPETGGPGNTMPYALGGQGYPFFGSGGFFPRNPAHVRRFSPRPRLVAPAPLRSRGAGMARRIEP